MAACAKGEVRTAPATDLVTAIDWRNQSVVNQSIDYMIWSGLFYWGQWQLSTSIWVTENGVASRWEGLAIETAFVDVREPSPCRPRGGIELYAWRPLADSSGIDGIHFWSHLPASPDDQALGTRRRCPFNMYSFTSPMLSRATLRHTQGTGGWIASSGQAHVQPIGWPAAGPSCRLASGQSWDDRCEEISVGATIRATLRRQSTPQDTAAAPTAELVLGPATIKGVRMFRSCEHSGIRFCADSSLGTMARFLLEHTEVSPHDESIKYLTTWKGDTALRTSVQVRFSPRLPDSAIAYILARWGAAVDYRWPAGSFWLSVPDPGPAPEAFQRMLERLRRHAGVESVYPLSRSWSPLVPAGRVVTRIVDQNNRPTPGRLFCFGPGLRWLIVNSAFCRTTNDEGRATFDRLPATDLALFAACPRPNGAAPVVTDSIVVQVQPRRTVRARFRPMICDAR